MSEVCVLVVLTGKLFHLSFLLPNLRTGANFGITSYLTGICRLIDLNLLEASKRQLMRGFDGDSANVCKYGLGLNCVLVKERCCDLIQQHRLPPDHSHTWQTDGLFSVIEGWLLHEGFTGCATLSQLHAFLCRKFAEAKAYKDKRVEIRVLLANFCFTHWLDGCVEVKKLNNIGVPLIWRHVWNESTKEVVSQYKMALSDEGTFYKSEWGPWVEETVEVEDATTGVVSVEKVLRSDAKGIHLMKSYPDVNANPGWEDWIQAENSDEGASEGKGWSCGKVFKDLKSYVFTGMNNADSKSAHDELDALHRWHLAHPTPDSLFFTDSIRLDTGQVIPAGPVLSWQEMWVKLKRLASHCAFDNGENIRQSEAQDGLSAAMAIRDLRHPDRQAIAMASSAAVANVVTHAGYTGPERMAALAGNKETGALYIQETIDSVGALFLIELMNFEGEFRVGLGRRTFNSELDDLSNGKYHIEWFERVSKRTFAWGESPTFKLTDMGTNSRRQTLGPQTSVEDIKDFIQLKVH